jgi:hypothetical protein
VFAESNAMIQMDHRSENDFHGKLYDPGLLGKRASGFSFGLLRVIFSYVNDYGLYEELRRRSRATAAWQTKQA